METTVTLKEGPFKIDELKPGELQKHPEQGYYLACPKCGIPMSIRTWDVKIDSNGITIRPSIANPKMVNGQPNGHQCDFHIFVTNSKIEYL